MPPVGKQIVCHYEVLDVARDADASEIKKAHRKLALKLHPDKNNGETMDSFRLVQQAYECLSDPSERKWYDQHREAILQGWSGVGESTNKMDILFDVVPFQHATCYNGYGDDEEGFYHVYNMVFELVFEGEDKGWTSEGNIEAMPLLFLPTRFGFADSEWSEVSAFYQAWESFSSCLAYAWTDKYDTKEAPNRRIRRAMEDENKKARRTARRERNENIEALVHFVKRRDPRVKAQRIRIEEERQQKELIQKEEATRKKELAKEAREEWKRNAELQMAQAQEEDRLAGRIRLADLEDGYDYSGGGKRGKGKCKKGKNVTVEPELEPEEYYWADSDVEEEMIAGTDIVATGDQVDAGGQQPVGSIGKTEVEEAIDIQGAKLTWRCECCRKNFDNEDLLKNHSKGRSHREARSKYLASQAEQQKRQADEIHEKKEYLDLEGGKRRGGRKQRHQTVPSESNSSYNIRDVPSVTLQQMELGEKEKIEAINGSGVTEGIRDRTTNGQKNESEAVKVWRCDYCLKNFKSLGQMEHHTGGKKHQEAVKMHQMEEDQKRAKELQALQDAQALELAEKIQLATIDTSYDYSGNGKRKDNKKKERKRLGEPESGKGSDFCLETSEEVTPELKVEEDIDVTLEELSSPDDLPDVDRAISEDESEESQPQIWNCESCRKDFKSEGQMENHMKSKKHKEALKKYQAQQKRVAMQDREALLDELALHP